MPADDPVLLLDIHAAERNRLAALLSQLGYHAAFTDTTDAGMGQQAERSAPIVIANVRGDPVAIAALRMQFPDSAIVVIGALSLAAALAAWHAGANGYLPRPVRDTELADVLEHTKR